MDKFIDDILVANNVICSNIEKKDVISDDGLLAQNVLCQLRNFVEAIALKIYSIEHDVEINQEGRQKAIKYIKSQDKLVFLQRFHKSLEITDSHKTMGSEAALRLMWRYYDYLIDCKNYVKEHFDLDVLYNIDQFPLEEDNTLKEYYRKIAKKVDKFSLSEVKESPTDRYYIVKKKTFRVDNQKYYEITIKEADDKTSKFDRLIVFTKINIPSFYAVHLKFVDSKIDILENEMPIKIVTGFKVSTRPCEFNNFFKILGYNTKVTTSDKEYAALMNYLSKTSRNLIDFLDFDEEEYDKIKERICADIKNSQIFNGLSMCRTRRGKSGYNVLRYLLYRLNNLVIKAQLDKQKNEKLSNLYLKYQCIPFDKMPFANNPNNVNPNLLDLYDCFECVGRENELLARTIKTNTEMHGQLYTPIKDLESFGDIEYLIEQYNQSLYYKHIQKSSLKLENGQVFISGYEKDTVDIIKELQDLTKQSIVGYTDSVDEWMKKSAIYIDDKEKVNVLKNIFAHSKVGLIYGSAGTGKSTTIRYISDFFRDKAKIYLANTNAAVDNLKKNIGKADNNSFYTIKTFFNIIKFNSCDILFIDECSTISNEDMSKILLNARFKLLVLVGDIYQIESIKFGNWFYIAKTAVSKQAVFELNYVYRSTEGALKALWDSVRKLDGKSADIMEANNYCSSMDKSIFVKQEEDEIILCLNYDGLYGINNINKFLQSSNSNKSIQVGIEEYKVGDPIIFKETQRFADYLYNNLKGKIVDFNEENNRIKFTVEIDTAFNSFDAEDAPFELEEPLNKGKSVISFYVDRFTKTNDEDKGEFNIVPFKVAYAVSIHKAQGLEYDSVKIVITDEVEELITHNIFYTAITRTKKKLKIYWTKRAEQYILDEMHPMFNNKDASILSQKFGLNLK